MAAGGRRGVQRRGAGARAAIACTLGVLAAAVVAGGGCQAIVGDAVPSFTCSGTALSSCPVGHFCRGSGCVPCEQRDVCDGFDNDCNGRVDDGELSDHDGDGFTFCGYVAADSGNKLVFDCDDKDKDIHPSAPELCNGKDDDCDGIVDNPGVACAANETCVPKTARCVDPASLCSPKSCPAPKVCDAETQECVTPNAAKLGEACTANRACESGVCGDAATLTQAVTENGNFCTKPCCASTECPREFLCYATGAGGNYCVPQSALKISASLGVTVAGDTCQSDSDCRSGLCGPTSKRCIDTCCSDANCRGGTSCRLAASDDGKVAFACLGGGGTRDQNQACSANSECRSGYCHNYGWNGSYCANECCGSAGCGTVVGFFFDQDLACRNSSVGTHGDVASLCNGQKQGGGTAPVGAPCNADSACASELCLTLADNSKKCSDVCCTDADCARAGWVCRPTSVQKNLYLRCVPK